jgi:hypothetical protein
MKLHAKSVVAAVATVAITAGTMLLGSTAANAAVTVPWEPDTVGSVGSITLYDASGAVVTGGSTTSHPFVAYAVANGTTTDTGANKFAHLSLATPDGTNLTYNYASEPITADTTYPRATGPAAITGAGASDFSFADYFADFPNNRVDAQAGLYQLRLVTPSTAAHAGAAQYFSVDIQVVGTTWTVVYPAPVAPKVVTTISAITPNPVSPTDHGTSVTLSATVGAADASHPAGTVQWFDGVTPIAGGTFAAASGAASLTLSPTDGDHTYKATFTPTDLVTYSGAVSTPTLAYHVNAPGAVSSVALTADNTGGAEGSAVTLSATVVTNPTGGSPAGSTKFFDGALLLGTVSTGSPTFVLNVPGGFSAGAHHFSAVFTASNTAVWTGTPSTSNTVDATYLAAACTTCTDPQTIQVTVDSGSLIISTPYGPAHPLDLGHMTLDPQGRFLSASANLGSVSNGTPLVTPGTLPVYTGPGSLAGQNGGIAIIDTRAGQQGWHATVKSTNLTDAASDVINAQNIQLVGVTPGYISGNSLQAISVNDVTSTFGPSGFGYAAAASGSDGLAGAGHPFASAPVGASVGTVYVDGVIGVRAPTSTPAGVYTATVTFTVA